MTKTVAKSRSEFGIAVSADAKTRRALRKVGTRVKLTDNSEGTVTGHYDDDLIFVHFDGAPYPERCYVVDLAPVAQ